MSNIHAELKTIPACIIVVRFMPDINSDELRAHYLHDDRWVPLSIEAAKRKLALGEAIEL